METNIATGITLASFTDGKQVSTAVSFVLQGNNGSWTTIASDQYDVARANGRVFKRLYDDSDNAVDWSAYTSYRATYALYDPTTQITTTYTNEAQTYGEFDFFPAVFDPSSGKLNATLLDGLVVTATQFADSIGSDNFSSGVSGWQITRAGDAEFNDIVARGTIYASAGEITGVLTIGASGGIFQGTGSFATPTTALKIYNSGGVGLWELWGSGTKQVYANSSGQLVAGAGSVYLDADGISIASGATTPNRIKWNSGSNVSSYLSGDGGVLALYSNPSALAPYAGTVALQAKDNSGGQANFDIVATGGNQGYATLYGGTTFVGLSIAGNAIGSFIPSSLLHLKSTAPTFRMEDSTASAKSLLLTVDANYATFDEAGGATSNLLKLDLANGRIGILNASPSVTLDVTGAVAISSNLAVDTNTLYVDATNNRVGVGTASPSAVLNVEGAVIFNDTGADVDFRIEGDTNANLFFVDASADKIGIGTSAPARLLEVSGTSSAIRVTNTTGSVYQEMQAGTALGAFGTVSNHSMTIFTNNTTRATVDTSGNIGIGTGTFGASAAIELAMKTGTAPTGNVTDVFQLYSADITAGNAAPHFRTENGDIIKIYKSGTVTQTYSTADATLANLTAATLTDNSGGSADTTLAAVEASYTQATIRNNFADLAAMVNKNTADHADLAQFVNYIADALQLNGILG